MSSNTFSYLRETPTQGMRIACQHRLDPMPCDLGKVGVIDAGGAEVGDVRVAALVGADVQAGGLLGRVPEVAVEVALAPHAAGWGREEQLAVLTV